MQSDSNTIEITDSGNKYLAYFFISLLIIGLVITNLLMGFISSTIVAPNTKLGLIILVQLPLSAIFLYLIIYVYGLFIKISKVIISAKTIEFIHGLRRGPVIINWSDFDTIRLKVKGLKSHKTLDSIARFAGAYVSGKSMTTKLLIKFSRKKPTRFSKVRNLKLFNGDKVQQIIDTLISYAEKHDKNIDIERRTKNLYRPTD